MSHVVVVNSFAKTVRINTTPGKDLTAVKNEACQKFGLNQDQFTLKYNNKPISLSQQIRFANLPQGARLELVQASRSPTVISVALQLPVSEKGGRLTQKFASNTSLWEILRQFESGQGGNFNFTQRAIPEMSSKGTSGAGRMYYEMPVITIPPDHKERSTFVDLQKTLSQLGFDNGSALLRLTFKNSGTPLEEAMAQISQYFKSTDAGSGSAQAEGSTQKTSIPGQDTAAPEATAAVGSETARSQETDPSPMEIDENPLQQPASEPTIPTVEGSADMAENLAPPSASPIPTPSLSQPQQSSKSTSRSVQVFAASTSATPQAARQSHNETDYIPTIEHAKAHQASLNRSTRNTRLLSDKELEQQAAAKQEKLDATAEKGGSLRVRLPDGALIQANIFKTDTAEDVYRIIDSCLARKTEPFTLQYRGPLGQPLKMPRSTARIFQDLGFSGNELVTFLWGETASADARSSKNVLAQEWVGKAQALKVEEPVAAQQNEEPVQSQEKAEGKKKVMSASEKESKLKNFLLKGKFGKK